MIRGVRHFCRQLANWRCPAATMHHCLQPVADLGLFCEQKLRGLIPFTLETRLAHGQTQILDAVVACAPTRVLALTPDPSAQRAPPA